MKPFCACFVAFCTVLVLCNGQRNFNWDQNGFGPRTRFFGQGSDDDSGTGRRNFFGNNFGPGQMFPRRPTLGEGDRGQGGQGVPQPLPPAGQTPEAGGGMAPEAPPPQPPPGQGLGQMGPMGGEDEAGEGQEEMAAPQQPPMQQGPGPMGSPAIRGSGPQPPMSRGPPVGVPEEEEQGMGQPPPQGQTEFVNPQQRPMPESPDDGIQQGQFGGGQPPMASPRGMPPQGQPPMAGPGGAPSQGQPPMAGPGGPPPQGQPPMTPETQGPSPAPQPGMNQGRMGGGTPMGQSPDQEIGGGDQGMLRSAQRPIRQGPDMGRPRRPLGQMMGARQDPLTFEGFPSQQRMGVQRRL